MNKDLILEQLVHLPNDKAVDIANDIAELKRWVEYKQKLKYQSHNAPPWDYDII